MTPTTSATGRQRRVYVPAPVPASTASVPLAPPQVQDPPIYRDLMRTWADGGRTLPGRHDPEWARLSAPQVTPGQFSGSRDPRGDGR
ncbi:hypothetical protein OG252_41190 [Streptomyces sp. NBC_01352]|uniref:hypothetical protein n=1 Tax=Streptomyces TaxID=1883 RepID=UPI00386D40FB